MDNGNRDNGKRWAQGLFYPKLLILLIYVPQIKSQMCALPPPLRCVNPTVLTRVCARTDQYFATYTQQAHCEIYNLSFFLWIV